MHKRCSGPDTGEDGSRPINEGKPRYEPIGYYCPKFLNQMVGKEGVMYDPVLDQFFDRVILYDIISQKKYYG